MKQNSRISHAEQIRTSDVEQILSSPPLLLLFLFPNHSLDTFSKPKNGWIEWEKRIKTEQVKHKNISKWKEKQIEKKAYLLKFFYDHDGIQWDAIGI